MPARFFRFVALAVLALSSLVHAQAGFKPLPKLVVQAKYVLVTTYQGYNLASPYVMPDDREAVVAVQNAIKKWGRYQLAYKPGDADLILLVRKGRIVATQPQMRVGKTSTTPWEVSGAAPVDAGDGRDMLAMFEADNGLDTPALWRDFEDGGLDTPNVALVQQLRKAVEETAKIPYPEPESCGKFVQKREFNPNRVRNRTLFFASEQFGPSPVPKGA